jgi:hypothetical protein
MLPSLGPEAVLSHRHSFFDTTKGNACPSFISAPLEVRVYLRDLASAANGSTNENSCGSVLADQASDADEFGDISVCLGTGQYGEGRELDILLALNSTPRGALSGPPHIYAQHSSL